MLYEVHREVAAGLLAKGYSLPVVYRERTQAEGFESDRVVLQHVRGNGDSFGAPVGPAQNPRAWGTVAAAASMRIYARDTQLGAAIQDHERLAWDYFQAAGAELWKALRRRRNRVDVERWAGGFIDPEAMEGTEVWGGAVYELTFPMERHLFDRTWEGVGRPTKAIAGIKSQTSVAGDIGSGGTETACNAVDP